MLYWGGGILTFTIFINLHAIELNQICTSTTEKCKITTPQTTITNHAKFTAPSDEGVYIEASVGTFTNYGDIIENAGNQSFTFSKDGYIASFINYGNISKNGNMSFWGSGKGISNLTNYGTMGAIDYNSGTVTMTLNNFGVIKARQGWHISAKNNILIANYALNINENATTFNKFSGYSSSSHLVISGSGVKFKDGNSKIILDFDKDFEFGAGYLISKIATDTSWNPYKDLGVDFGRLTTKSDIYYITQQDDKFIVHFAPQHSTIGNLYKANIRTMNNFLTISNSMIYPHKYSKSQNLGRKNSLRMSEANVAIQDLKAYESFAYQNESQNPQTRRIKRPNKRNYSRSLNNSQNLNADSANRANKLQNQRFSQNLAQNPNDYYFILTPFVNHNNFAKSGNYNLSGFDYGFLTAFSGKITPSNSLGAHFMMSYGTLGDLSDKDFHISNLNLNFGLNYKLDLIWDMYLKARGDFFYFLNQVKTLTMMEAIKPNNLGFGVSVSYGKDFDFKQGGIIGIEGGIDYKALSANEITLDSMSETYHKSLYHLLYVDLGIAYAKYFGNFGINANLGIKGNVTANKLAKSKINLKNFNQSVDMILDNDKILGYANLGLSYVLNARNFDMEFSLAYYGNYGDRIISNGGGFEWRAFF